MITAVLALALFVLLALDWLQTLTIATHPRRWRERNPMLGEHPAPWGVHLWFSACAWALVIGLLVLPASVLKPALMIWVVGELWCVWNNHRLGIRL